MNPPRLRQTVLDTEDPRGLAEFYRVLLDLAYRPGDEPPEAGRPDPRGEDWLVLVGEGGAPPVATVTGSGAGPSCAAWAFAIIVSTVGAAQ